MRKICSKILMSIFVFGLVILTASSSTAIPIVSIEPSSASSQVGDTLDLNIMISGVTDLYGVQFTIGFDSAVIMATDADIIEGTFLNEGGTVSTFFFKPSSPELDVSTTRLGPIGGVDGSGILATISFNAVGLGTSPVSLSDVQLSDSGANPISYDLSNGTVSVVPEPSSFFLLGTGLFGLLALNRKGVLSSS